MFVAVWARPQFQRRNASGGSAGNMIAVDLAERLLEKGRRRAAQLGLANIEFRKTDLESLPFPDEAFDAVLCVFGIFFVRDLRGAIRGLWRLVRPGGMLAVTIWDRNLFEPADGIFWEAVRREDPELYRSIKSWSKVFEPEPLCALLKECGVTNPRLSPSRAGIRFGSRRIGGRSSLDRVIAPQSKLYPQRTVNKLEPPPSLA